MEENIEKSLGYNMGQSIHLDQITLSQLVLHKVGNKSQDEGIRIAKKLFNLIEDLREILMSYFLSGFKMEDILNLTTKRI